MAVPDRGCVRQDVPEQFGDCNMIYRNSNRRPEAGARAKVLEHAQPLAQACGDPDPLAPIDVRVVRASAWRYSAPVHRELDRRTRSSARARLSKRSAAP